MNPLEMQHPSESSHPAVRKKPALKWLGTGLAAVLTLGLLFHAVENWRGSRKWAAVRNELKAKGVPLSYEEYYGKVPDAENFFAAAIVRKKLFSDNGGSWLSWDSKISGASEAAFGENGQFSARAAMDWMRDHSGSTPAPSTGDPVQDLLAALEPAAAGLTELETAAKLPYAQLLPDQWNDSHRAMKSFIVTTRILELRSAARLEAGQIDLAARDAELIFALARANCRKAHSFMAVLISTAMSSSGLGAISRLCPGCQDVRQLAGPADAISSLNLLQPEVFRGEMAFDISFIEAWYAGKTSVPLPAIASLLPSGWGRLFEAEFATFLDRRFDQVAVHGWRAAADTPIKPGWLPPVPFGGASDDDDPFIARSMLRRVLKAQANLEMARIAVAATRIRLTTGKLPATLEAMAGEFPGGRPPLDPQTDTPFLWMSASDGSFTITCPEATSPAQDGDNSFRVAAPTK